MLSLSLRWGVGSLLEGLPRMIAQPAVNTPDGFALDGSDPSPVAQAIVTGLAMAN